MPLVIVLLVVLVCLVGGMVYFFVPDKFEITRALYTGEVMCEEERLTSAQALQAITINAAHVLGFANETGSIRAGKMADFTVLEEDPLIVDSSELRDIPIKATVFEGTVFGL